MTELFNGRIFTINSSTGTSLWSIIQYEKKREGANMLYRFNYKVYISNGSGTPNPYGSYQNNLRATFTLNGNSVWEKDTKSSSTGWSFEYTTDWFTVSNKTSGTTPFKFTIKDTQNSSWCNYTSGTFSLGVDPAGSDLGAVANFNIGNTITVPITKYASMYDVVIVKIGSTTIKTINNAPNPTTVTFTSSELNTIYGLTTGDKFKDFAFELKSYTDSSKTTLVGEDSTTARGYIVGSDPVINSITVMDTNSTTVALTGNSSKIVRYKSNVKVSVSVSPVNQATIKSVTINGKTATLSSGYYVATFNSVNTNSFDVKVIDSRDFPTNKNLTISSSNYIQYVDLTLNASVYRDEPTNGKLVIDYSGNYFNGSFGSTSNSLTVQYRYIQKGGSWNNATWNTLTPTINGNTYNGNLTIDGFDYQKQYVFQVRAIDKIDTIPVNDINVSKGEPILYWNENLAGVNGDFVVKDGKAIKSGKTFYTEDREKFQTNVFGVNDDGFKFKTLRSGITGNSYFPQYSSGFAWASHDTHGLLFADYRASTPQFIVGGGNGDKINWIKKVAFKEDWDTSGGIEDFKEFVVNEAPIGSNVYYLNFNGSVSCAIVLKASASYSSFIWFSYGVEAIQYRYNNGSWTINDFSNQTNIVEMGTYWAGRYIKYSDGTMVCRGRFELGVTTSSWGSIHFAGFANPHSFPVSFKSVDTINVTPTGSSSCIVAQVNYSTSQITYLGVASGASLSNKTMKFDFEAWGTW